MNKPSWYPILLSWHCRPCILHPWTVRQDERVTQRIKYTASLPAIHHLRCDRIFTIYNFVCEHEKWDARSIAWVNKRKRWICMLFRRWCVWQRLPHIIYVSLAYVSVFARCFVSLSLYLKKTSNREADSIFLSLHVSCTWMFRYCLLLLDSYHRVCSVHISIDPMYESQHTIWWCSLCESSSHLSTAL